MSELERLVQELCPNGVPFRELSEVLTIKNGKDYKSFDEGDIPVYGSGGIMTYIDTSAYNKPSVLIPRKGSLDKLYYVDTPFWNVDTIFYTEINESIVVPKYIFYCLQKQHLERLNKAGGVPSLTQSVLNKVVIPVPPIEVQGEIVRILDNFTELTEELTAELTARKKQYEYYRDELLTFGDDVEWLPLGTVFNVRNGYTPSKANEKFWEGGTIPWFRLEDIRKNGRFLFDALQHITSAAVKRGGLFPANSLIISTTATIGEHALLKTEGLSNQQITNCSLKDKYAEKVNPQFAFYYFYKLGEWCKANINQGGGLAIIGTEKIKQFLFPIPPIEEQQRIVDILDRFDTLCNNISAGLPAEIEARQKQYEYYRDKLLTFQEMSV